MANKSNPAPSARNRLRIVGGRWRGMHIDFPAIEAIRPSPDRVRETLFNWLQSHIAGAHCLDLFAGSGALGIEALSRGAERAVFVDREPQIGRHLTQTLARLGAGDGASVVVADALRFLARPAQPFSIVYQHPPFAAGLIRSSKAAEALSTRPARGATLTGLLPAVFERLPQGWLAPQAHIYVECSADTPLPPLPPQWAVYRAKQAGQVGYHLLRSTD